MCIASLTALSLTCSATSTDMHQIALMLLDVDIEVFATLAADRLMPTVSLLAYWVACRFVFVALVGLHNLSWLDVSLLG